jgi:hypothetical protein
MRLSLNALDARLAPGDQPPIECIVEDQAARTGAMTREKEEGFERRLEAVEQAVAENQRRRAGVPDSDNWLERVVGSISDGDAFDEALK